MFSRLIARIQGGSNSTAASKVKVRPTESKRQWRSSLLSKELKPAVRAKYLKLLESFPDNLLKQLIKDGVRFTTVEAGSPKTPYSKDNFAGGYVPNLKTVFLHAKDLGTAKGKRFAAHEIGHAVDHQLYLRTSLQDLFSSPASVRSSYGQMSSSSNSKMKGLYQSFQVRQLASEASSHQTDGKKPGMSTRKYPGSEFTTRVSSSWGKTKVVQAQTKYEPSSIFAERQASWFGSKSTYNFSGVEVTHKRTLNKDIVTYAGPALPKLGWLVSSNSGQYLQQSGQQAELFADGVGAYLGNEKHRQSLYDESRGLHNFVESQLQKYIQAPLLNSPNSGT